MKNKTILFNSFNTLPIDKNILSVFMILIGSLSIGILAQASIPIPFSPVPITGQTIGVVLIGSLLGKRRGTLSIILYLMEGSLGLPVFANMQAGLHILFGPTGGYLFSFIIAAFLMGYFKEKGFITSPIKIKIPKPALPSFVRAKQKTSKRKTDMKKINPMSGRSMIPPALKIGDNWVAPNKIHASCLLRLLSAIRVVHATSIKVAAK